MISKREDPPHKAYWYSRTLPTDSWADREVVLEDFPSTYISLATKNTSVLRTPNVCKNNRLKLGVEHSW